METNEQPKIQNVDFVTLNLLDITQPPLDLLTCEEVDVCENPASFRMAYYNYVVKQINGQILTLQTRLEELATLLENAKNSLEETDIEALDASIGFKAKNK